MLELWKAIRIVLFAIFPIVAIAVPLAFDITVIVFQRGKFRSRIDVDNKRIYMVLTWTFGYSLICFFGSCAFYSLQDTRTPMFCGIVVVIVNIILSITLSPIVGIGGIAIGTTVSNLFAACLLLLLLRKKIGHLGFFKTFIDILKMLLGSVLCTLALTCTGLSNLLPGISSIIRFVICALAGGGVYILVMIVLKELVLTNLWEWLLNWLKRA